MSRTYFRVYGPNTVNKAKWRTTPMVVRGALLTLWMAASMQAVEGVWKNRADLEADLEADGCPKVTEVVDRLINLKWLDCGPDGCKAHDWMEWQASMRVPSDSPKAVSGRVTKHRDAHQRPSRRKVGNVAGDIVSNVGNVADDTSNVTGDAVGNVTGTVRKAPKSISERVAKHRAAHRNEGNGGNAVTLRVTGVTGIGEERREEERTRSSSLRSEDLPVLAHRQEVVAQDKPPTKPPRKPILSPRQKVLFWLTDHKVAHPIGYVNGNLNELIRIHGPGKVIASLEADHTSKTVKQYVAGVEQDLSPPLASRNGSTAKSNGSRPEDTALIDSLFKGKESHASSG